MTTGASLVPSSCHLRMYSATADTHSLNHQERQYKIAKSLEPRAPPLTSWPWTSHSAFRCLSFPHYKIVQKHFSLFDSCSKHAPFLLMMQEEPSNITQLWGLFLSAWLRHIGSAQPVSVHECTDECCSELSCLRSKPGDQELGVVTSSRM